MISLDEAIKQTNRTISESLKRFSGGLEELTAYMERALGKGARMRLLLNAAMDNNGMIPLNAPKAAAAIEILHMATLVHDDIIDDTPIRRGIETVQKKFGKKNAVICGDYLLCISLSTLSGVISEGDRNTERFIPIISRFSNALMGICQGEYRQNLNNGNLEMNLFTYLRIISGKTAALFYISAYLGAILGGENEKNALSLGRFGQCLGIIFQIIDDCKDYELSEEEALKPVGNDIANGVITLPLIMALNKDPSLRDLALDTMKNMQTVPRLISEVRRLEGPDRAREIVKRYDTKARYALRNIADEKREKLLAILDKTTRASAQF